MTAQESGALIILTVDFFDLSSVKYCYWKYSLEMFKKLNVLEMLGKRNSIFRGLLYWKHGLNRFKKVNIYMGYKR